MADIIWEQTSLLFLLEINLVVTSSMFYNNWCIKNEIFSTLMNFNNTIRQFISQMSGEFSLDDDNKIYVTQVFISNVKERKKMQLSILIDLLFLAEYSLMRLFVNDFLIIFSRKFDYRQTNRGKLLFFFINLHLFSSYTRRRSLNSKAIVNVKCPQT